MSNFRVGQKVVCIDDAGESAFNFMTSISKTAVYTVRWVGVRKRTGRVCVRLDGVYRFNMDGEDVPLRASRFRPVVEPGAKTGMSILRDLLNKAGKPIEVDS